MNQRQKMRNLYKHLKVVLRFLSNLYKKILFKTDKSTFAALFNWKSTLIRSSTKLRWCGDSFQVTDRHVDNFSYFIRHQRQCNMAYEFGVQNRAETLANCYFFDQINFTDGDIFFDCGANVGDLKIWFGLKKININYVGFEPSPVEFNCLKKNVFPSTVHNIGLWNEDAELTFYVSSQGADSSLIELKEYDETITCKVSRLDKFVTQPIKCLKLEAEGAEPEILEGLGEKIRMVEYITADLGYERGINSESTLVPVMNYLLMNDFELIDMNHGRICALFKNKSVRSKSHVYRTPSEKVGLQKNN